MSQLRLLRLEDTELILRWRNSERINKWMYNRHIISREEHEVWLEKALRSVDQFPLLFLIDDMPIGYVKWSRSMIDDAVFEWGFYIGDEKAPKGSGQKLGEAALHYAFYELNARKVIGEVIGCNDRSLRFHQKLGFTQEAELRQQRLFDGTYQDIIIFGMLREEYEKNQV